MARQSWRAPEYVRLTHCCKREPGVVNGRLWCPACGQHILRAAEVFTSFKSHPAPVGPPESVAPARGRRRGPNPDQGVML